MQVLTDPAECGPVTLALCQDVQAEAYDYPESFSPSGCGRRAGRGRMRDELARPPHCFKAKSR
jgi:3D-(3,5/4)-trihydroxycyclohexane-1,2-dione acylhydrolase (decyclizing)